MSIAQRVPRKTPRPAHKKSPLPLGKGRFGKDRLFLDHFGHGRVLAHGGDAVLAALLGRAAFAGGDDLRWWP